MNRTSLWLSLSLVACGGPAVGSDAGPVDAAGGLITARSFCEGLVACTPSLDVETCVAPVQADFDRVSALGCADEANGANACTLAIFRPGPSGTCMPDTFDCDVPYRAYNECVIAATGIEAFSCDARTSASASCVTYAGLGQAVATTCASISATVIASCPVDSAAGRCVRAVAGGGTLTITYYTPLPSGLTLTTLQGICESAAGGRAGTWTTL